MSKLKIVVLYDRVLVDESEEQAASSDKSPVVRTLDKKEVEDEVAEALTKLGHEPVMYELDGTQKSLLGAGASSNAIWSSTWPSRSPTTTPPISRSRPSSSCSGRSTPAPAPTA